MTQTDKNSCKTKKQGTHCDAAVLAPSWRRGGAASASALGDARLDEDDVGLELCRPQSPQGLESSHTAGVEGGQRSAKAKGAVSRLRSDGAHLRLHVHNAHLVLGLHRANGLYTGAVLVFLVLPVFNEPATVQRVHDTGVKPVTGQ